FEEASRWQYEVAIKRSAELRQQNREGRTNTSVLKAVVQKHYRCIRHLVKPNRYRVGAIFTYRHRDIWELPVYLVRFVADRCRVVVCPRHAYSFRFAPVSAADDGYAPGQQANKVFYHGSLARTTQGQVAHRDHRQIKLRRRLHPGVVQVIPDP